MPPRKRQRVSNSSTNDDPEISSSSQSVYETVKSSHEYKIKGYSLAKGMGIGECMTSDKFRVGGYDWVIEFYPDGYDQESEEYVSLYIKLVGPTYVRASCEFRLLDQSGKGIHYDVFDSSIRTFVLHESWGFDIHKSELETSSYLKDDCLIIQCTVGVVQEKKHNVICVPPSDMFHNLKGLLESGIGSDITFKVGSESFRAHKSILAVRSPVFRAQFYGLVGDRTTKKETVKDIHPLVFKAMLLYLYTDELPKVHELSDLESPCASTSIMQHLLVAADRYDLSRMKLFCEAKLCEEITANTVATTLGLADRHHCEQLRTACLSFAAKPENLGELMKSGEFADLEKSYPSVWIDLLNTCATLKTTTTAPAATTTTTASPTPL